MPLCLLVQVPLRLVLPILLWVRALGKENLSSVLWSPSTQTLVLSAHFGVLLLPP